MPNSPILTFKKPEHPSLTPHINYYYFYQSKAVTSHVEFIHFPHFKRTLNCFKDASITLSKYCREVVHAPKGSYTHIFHRHLKFPRKAILEGPFDIIGISFHPLGIFHFIDDDLAEQGHEFFFAQLGKAFNQQITQVFQKDSAVEKGELLDQFFVNCYRPFHHQHLQKAVQLILGHQGNISLQEICATLGVSRRTLHRYFTRYMACSFRDFKTVVKFRNAFDQYFQADQTNKLSELAYWANYYDQSDFISQFKTKTNATPTELLPHITPTASELFWKFSS
ncbi:MAG: helix-turn-helix domain-containing protein [Flammeovirgaceae bacterium]